MAFFIIFFLILLNSFSWSEETSDLMSQYETLYPFHENIAILKLDEKCKIKNKSEKVCWIDRKWEDNPQPLKDLLLATEDSIDTTNPDFAHTPLGQKYHQLKTFLNIHDRLKSCSASNSVINDAILSRAQSNLSLTLENLDDCKPVLQSSESDIALLGSHLQQVVNNNISAESSFENDLFAETLRNSIQSRVSFTKQFGSDDINTNEFKQKLLNQFCKRDVPTSTSRGIKKRRGWACTEKDEVIISNLIREAVDNTNDKKLIQHPIKLSHQSEECFNVQSKKKCIKTNLYNFQSTPPATTNENQLDFLDTPTVVADINYRIANLNSILEDYNEQKTELEEKWVLENPDINPEDNLSLPEKRQTDYNRSLKRKKLNDKLKKLKKEMFSDYKQELALLYANGPGILLQTDAIRNKSNFKEIERITTKGLGIFGFEEAELTHADSFPLLKPINDHTASLATKEHLSRIDYQIQNILSDQRNKHKIDQEYLDQIQNTSSEEDKQSLQEWYKEQRLDRLSSLVLFNPGMISSRLLENPEYSSVLCEIAKKVEEDEEFKENLKTALFIGSAAGSMAIGILTVGTGAPASLASAASLAVGLGLTATDFTLRITEVHRHLRNQEGMLNAYLSQTGDTKSIEDIRKEWKSAYKQRFHAGWALALGTFDVYRIRSAIKKVKAAKKSSSTDIPALRIQNNQLQRIITGNDQYMESIQGLLQKHSLSSVRRLLNTVKRLPPDQQKTVLDSFSKISKQNAFDLTAFNREIKQSSTKKNIIDILTRWSVCFSCRFKVGTKKTKSSSDAQSVIESTK